MCTNDINECLYCEPLKRFWQRQGRYAGRKCDQVDKKKKREECRFFRNAYFRKPCPEHRGQLGIGLLRHIPGSDLENEQSKASIKYVSHEAEWNSTPGRRLSAASSCRSTSTAACIRWLSIIAGANRSPVFNSSSTTSSYSANCFSSSSLWREKPSVATSNGAELGNKSSETPACPYGKPLQRCHQCCWP